MANPIKAKVSPGGTVGIGNRNVAVGVNPVSQGAGIQAGTNVGPVRVSVGAGINEGGPNVGANVGVRGSDGGVSVGANIGARGVSIGPTIQIGGGEGNAIGAAVGATAGTIVGSILLPGIGTILGPAVGSAIGSVAGGTFNPSMKTRERRDRETGIKEFSKLGIFENGMMVNPDGTKIPLDDLIKGGEHPWKDPSRRTKQHIEQKRDTLFNFDVDYTSDMDYVTGMAGINFARVLAGGASKTVDQLGGALSNGLLGKVGRGAQFNKDNFTSVMNNARSMYAKAGVKSKEDMLALANQLYASGKINDMDYAVVNQTSKLVFDNDFNLAQSLMAGRDKGIETATKTPAQGSVPSPFKNGSFMPYLSMEEAYTSLSPILNNARTAAAIRKKAMRQGNTAANIASGVSAGVAAFKGLDSLTGGSLSGLIKDGVSEIKDYFSTDDPQFDLAVTQQATAGDTADIASADVADIDFSLPEFDFGIEEGTV